MAPLVADPQCIRLAMAGMVEGNGHPFSWSAIINGRYDAEAMAQCGYPVIPQYLAAQPREALGIPGVQVTHVWCDDPADTARVSRAACIPRTVARAEDLIGQVDAVIIPTDKGEEHLERARPFIDAGLPVFIDKPLTDRPDHLAQFQCWHREGRPLMSTSCMRYAREYVELRERVAELGALRLVTVTTPKSWERYGIHALEGVYPFLDAGGWLSAANTGSEAANIVHARHRAGIDVVVAAIADMYGAFGCLGLYGTQGVLHVRFQDTFYAFKQQLLAFVKYLRTGCCPVAFEETVELMKLVIAGILSRRQSGRRISLEEIDGAGPFTATW